MFRRTLGDGEGRRKLLKDNLLRERGARSKPLLEPGREGGGDVDDVVKGGEEGRLDGRKNEGFLSTFIIVEDGESEYFRNGGVKI